MNKVDLKGICDSRNVTGYQLIKKTGLPKMTVYNLLNGTVEFRNTSVENAVKIAGVLGMTVEEIYKELYEGGKNMKELYLIETGKYDREGTPIADQDCEWFIDYDQMREGFERAADTCVRGYDTDCLSSESNRYYVYITEYKVNDSEALYDIAELSEYGWLENDECEFMDYIEECDAIDFYFDFGRYYKWYKTDKVDSLVEEATSSKTAYDLETYLPMNEDYDPEVHEFIRKLESSFDDDETYDFYVGELEYYYSENWDEYKEQFE